MREKKHLGGEEGMQAVVGRNPVLEALRGERALNALYLEQGNASTAAAQAVQLAKKRGIPVKNVSKEKLAQLSGGAAHQGMAATLASHSYADLEDIYERAGEDPLFVILLDELEDPHNLGAIVRTAEAAGAHGVVIPRRRSALLTPAAAKAAAGALEHLPVARVNNLSATIEELKARGVWVYAADMDGESYCATHFDGPVALVIGSEGRGVGRLVKENCDAVVSLPMYGQLGSLNASVAAGILMYEIARQRNGVTAVPPMTAAVGRKGIDG
ncbi:MAG: 23S rRNA (guanosine(2251)-2'-O)-methyltransferase RlmB [Provencibacterium sp.]|nr:23S rRNA (guanosine(2251)-2'-O)-methyltransferase RlmB [Provencibacterium sp.]